MSADSVDSMENLEVVVDKTTIILTQSPKYTTLQTSSDGYSSNDYKCNIQNNTITNNKKYKEKYIKKRNKKLIPNKEKKKNNKLQSSTNRTIKNNIKLIKNKKILKNLTKKIIKKNIIQMTERISNTIPIWLQFLSLSLICFTAFWFCAYFEETIFNMNGFRFGWFLTTFELSFFCIITCIANLWSLIPKISMQMRSKLITKLF